MMAPEPVRLDAAFLRHPIAHRGLHDRASGRPENSMAAFAAAIDAGYGIECDIQPSADGVAMVFHDYDLRRLTGKGGPITAMTAAELGAMPIHGSTETIPTLAALLQLVAGQVPLLIEIKDQDGAVGPKVGPLEEAVARDLSGYRGPVAVMSFNPYSVAAMARLAPSVARGVTAGGPDDSTYDGLSPERVAALGDVTDYAGVGASFVSYDHKLLTRPAIAGLKARGAAILCWTIRSEAEEARARKVAQNITFENYLAKPVA
ncbi:MAG: phosphodiesterase [Rhodobacteraceae bacterium]|nr:phosphodiesterase [Paracoccaceae bacterium]